MNYLVFCWRQPDTRVLRAPKTPPDSFKSVVIQESYPVGGKNFCLQITPILSHLKDPQNPGDLQISKGGRCYSFTTALPTVRPDSICL